MSAEAIALLIARFGIPLAEQIWKTIAKFITDKGDPSPEMWDELRALVSNTIENRLSETEKVVARTGATNTIENRLK